MVTKTWEFCTHFGLALKRETVNLKKLSAAEFLEEARNQSAIVGGDKIERTQIGVSRGTFVAEIMAQEGFHRRLVALPPSTQEPLYGLPAMQPTETIHAVGNAGADGMPLGQLAAIPIATVLIGFTIFRSFKALLKRFRTPKKGKASTSGNDTGIM